MNTLRNSVRLIGFVGKDPEVKNLDNNRKLAKLSVATNEYYTNAQGEKVNETTWHNLVAWGKTADLVDKLISKGSEVAVEGKLNNRSYEDKNGEKKYVSEIEIREIVMLGQQQKAAV